MLITEDFVFIHLPKTGGMFIRQFFKPIAAVDDLEGHGGVDLIPEEFRHLPVFAVIRNPWDWYVSEWQFSTEQGRTDRSFEDYLRWRCDWLPRRDRDYYSALWWRTFGKDPWVEVGRFENLRGDFAAFLDRQDVQIPELMDAPAVNASNRGPYQDYYSPELRDLVAHKCKHLIRTYGYEFSPAFSASTP